jgi:large subunit ribosomal protein L15
VKSGYEGGQTPLTVRIPKRGFVNIFRDEYETVNIRALSKFKPHTEVTPTLLREKKIIKGKGKLKILGVGEITIPLVVKAHKFSKTAQEKIIKAQGTVEHIQ